MNFYLITSGNLYEKISYIKNWKKSNISVIILLYYNYKL